MRFPRFPIGFAATFLALWWMALPQARAGIDLGVSYSNSTYHQLYGEVIDNRSESDTQNASDVRSASISLGSSLPQSAVSVWAEGGLIGPGDGLKLRTFASGAANGFYGYTLNLGNYENTAGDFLGTATARWNDSVRLTGMTGMLPSSVFLVADVGGSLSSVGNSFAEVLAWLESSAGLVSRDSAGSLMIEVPLDSSGAGFWDMLLLAGVRGIAQAVGPPSSSTEYAGATADFSHTMMLSSVLVQDANGDLVTPESLGYSVSFDSGMASPNVSSVPEPSSVVMLAMGTVGLLGHGWLRRKRRGA